MHGLNLFSKLAHVGSFLCSFLSTAALSSPALSTLYPRLCSPSLNSNASRLGSRYWDHNQQDTWP